MDLNHVAVFVRVVEAGSFTQAARALGVPTSTVSRQIAQLEEELGVRLLQRTSRSLHLTEAGAAYHERVATALGRINEATSDARETQDAPRGLIRFTAPVDLSIDYLTGPLAHFLEQYPCIQVDLSLTARTVDMISEGFDLALRAGSLRDPSLIARKIAGSEVILAAAPSYLERRGDPAEPGELPKHDCLGFRATKNRIVWDLLGPDGPIQIEVGCRLNADDFAFIKRMLLTGAGIAQVPSSLVYSELRAGQLRRVLPAYHMQAPGLYLVYPSAKHLPRRVALLRDHLLKAFSPPPWERSS